MSKDNALPKVAYFCMEFGLDPSFHIYAGGLGILAGDYLKAAKDYDIPIIGVGIRWRQGYTHQEIDQEGRPYDIFATTSMIFKRHGGKGAVSIRHHQVVCKVWKVDVFGNAPLYLLDTHIPENQDSWITGQLYGRMGEERIAQEMILGIGGVRALKAMGLQPDIYHFNEGHAVLAGLELIRQYMSLGMDFNSAFSAVRSKIVFTTHTPVAAGNEAYSINQLIYMGANNTLTREQLSRIGGSPFNMTAAALRLSMISNAVSELHSRTANHMWEHITDRADIIGITNGIHIPTWVDDNMLLAAEKNGNLWDSHMDNKMKLIEFVKARTGIELDLNTLLIGFARRTTSYKRPDLLFRDPEIIIPMLKEKRLQLIFSGKAHPMDDTGKAIVSNLVRISRQFPESVVFLENYDMNIGKALTRGVDVWLNNPRRPLEACGTSGMKAAMNGVLNLSTLDGWWAEACQYGINGWQFGNGFTHQNPAVQDEHDTRPYTGFLMMLLSTYYYDPQMGRNDEKQHNQHQALFDIKRMMDKYYERMYTAQRKNL